MIISFIGCGFSANSVLYHLNKLSVKVNSKININVFESRQHFGDGVAYNLNIDHVLLNRPAEYMSIDHHNLSDFNRYKESKGIISNEFETRKLFGLYLTDVFESTVISLKQKNIIVNKYNHTVLDINQMNNKFEIITSSGYFFSDIVILSTGNNHQNNIWHLNSPRYINNLYYEFSILNQIKPNERVLIIGTSLSAIDCALFLESNYHTGPVGCMSRSGIIPKIRLTKTNVELPVFNQLVSNYSTISLFKFIKYFRKQVKILDQNCSWRDLFDNQNKLDLETLYNEMNKRKDVVQNILVSSNPYIEELWDKLSNQEKVYFFCKFYTLYMSNRNPMPNISARRLFNQLKTNKLKIFSNEISSISFNNNEFIIQFADGNLETFNWVINATGQSRNIEVNPLYDNLLKHGLVKKNIIGGLAVHKFDQQCLNAKGKVTSGLYAIGPKTLGTYINVNSAEMLSIKAESIAKQLVQRIGFTNE